MKKTKKRRRKTFTRRDFLKSLGGGTLGAGMALKAFGQTTAPSLTAQEELEAYSKKKINLKVNGKNFSLEVEPRETLLDVLRERLKLTGTKRICNRGECGGCTVLLDGKPVYSCHLLALAAHGKELITIEGLASGDKLHPVQQAFIDKDGYQCGFCTPGFIMSSVALLKTNSAPSQEEMKAALAGNLCRCGNYQKIFEAVSAASQTMKKA